MLYFGLGLVAIGASWFTVVFTTAADGEEIDLPRHIDYAQMVTCVCAILLGIYILIMWALGAYAGPDLSQQ